MSNMRGPLKKKLYNLENVYDIEDSYWWFKAKRRLLVRIVKNLICGIKGKARLLDAGCGTGANLREAQKLIPSVGIEKFFDGIKCCSMRNLKNVLAAELEYLPFRREVFDIILALDILEHVDDDMKVLNEISRISKNGAIVVLHVPAFMFLWCDHDIAVDHKRRYVAGELKKRLTQAGFSVMSIRYRLCFFFFLGIIRKYLIAAKNIWQKKIKIKPYRPKTSALINDILCAIVTLEDEILNHIRIPFGLSIVCIAQKQKNNLLCAESAVL